MSVAFVARYGLRLTVLRDPKGTVAAAYGVDAVPWTFIIDAQGRLVSSYAGLLTRRALDNAVARAASRQPR